MKTTRNALVSLLAVLFLVASCTGALDQTKTASPASTGTVRLAIPGVSAGLQAAIDKHYGVRNSAPTVPSLVAADSGRAFIAANHVRASFFKNGILDHDRDFYPNSIVDSASSVSVASENLAAGTWAVKVYVYNNYSTEPTVASPQTTFVVTEGMTISVNVTCVPAQTSILSGYNSSEGTAFTLYPAAPWVFNQNTVTTTGSEHWFQFQATSSTFFTVINAKDVAGSGSVPWFVVADAAGNYLGQTQPDANGLASIQVPTSPNAIYYVGVIDAGTGVGHAIHLWYGDGVAPSVNLNLDTFGVWADFILNQNSVNVHQFQAQAGVSYKVGWNDGYPTGGDQTKTKDLAVDIKGVATGYNYALNIDSAFDFDGSLAYLGKAAAVLITPASSEAISITAREYTTGSPSGTYGLKVVPLNVHNSLFALAGSSDWNGTYNTATDVNSHLNLAGGDLLPGWKFELDANDVTANPGAQIDIGPGNLRLVGNGGVYSGWGMAATQEGFTYSVTGATLLDIGFTINSFADMYGGYSSPYDGNFAPLNVWVKFSDVWHELTSYTTGYNYMDYYQGNLATGFHYGTTDGSTGTTLNVAGRSTSDGYYIYPGTIIQGVKLESRGSYWDVTIDHATFTEGAMM